jgi:hypothetical protein
MLVFLCFSQILFISGLPERLSSGGSTRFKRASGRGRKNFLSLKEKQDAINSVADPGCSIRIPDPNFFHPGSRIRIFSIPDPHKELKYFNQNIVSKLSEILSGLFIPDTDPDFFTLLGSRIQGSKRHLIPDPDPQHYCL